MKIFQGLFISNFKKKFIKMVEKQLGGMQMQFLIEKL